MGYEKYLVSREPQPVQLQVEDETLELKVRGLPWAKKNQLVSLSLRWDEDGKTSFDGDNYIRECLKYMIVEAPWGTTNDAFLIQVGDNALGAALEGLVPKAFGKGESPNVQTVKKEL